MAGWIRIPRGWQDDPVFRGEPFSRRDALLWLIAEAAFRPQVVATPGGKIHLARGQLSHSLRYMAKAWRWDDAKVRRFLKATQEAKKIDASTDAGQTVITICDYDIFQGEERHADAAPDAPVTQQRRGDDAKIKKERKEEESKPTRYAFQGRTIRLTQAHFDGWAAAYHSLPDLRAELTSIDEWWEGQPPNCRSNWFQATSGMLNKKHQRNVAARRQDLGGEQAAERNAAFEARRQEWERENPEVAARYAEMDRLAVYDADQFRRTN